MLAVELVAAVMMEGEESSSVPVVDAIAAAALQCECDGCCSTGPRLLAARAREIGHPARPMGGRASGGVGRRVYTRGEGGQ